MIIIRKRSSCFGISFSVCMALRMIFALWMVRAGCAEFKVKMPCKPLKLCTGKEIEINRHSPLHPELESRTDWFKFQQHFFFGGC